MFSVGSVWRLSIYLILAFLLQGCFVLQHDMRQGPVPERPVDLDLYYNRGNSYNNFTEKVTRDAKPFQVKRILIETDNGQITVDYFQRREATPELILVFPLLGVKNIIPDYFAEYFARKGYDAAIIHRVNDFKDPNKFDQLEGLMRGMVVRDRIAIDFFEKEYKKTTFASFGISRGAINASMTAGVDPRLKVNVLAMGATDMVRIMRTSTQGGIKKYREAVMKNQDIDQEEFFSILREQLKTDPKYLAGYLDPQNTLLFLALFDSTVPINWGVRLRRQIGNPRTVYLLADHYTSVLYTQMASNILANTHPGSDSAYFPFDYIETEALDFYNKRLRNERGLGAKMLAFRLLQGPIDLVVDVFARLFSRH